MICDGCKEEIEPKELGYVTREGKCICVNCMRGSCEPENSEDNSTED